MLNVIFDLLTKHRKTERRFSNLHVDGTLRETIDVLAHYVASMCKFAFKMINASHFAAAWESQEMDIKMLEENIKQAIHRIRRRRLAKILYDKKKSTSEMWLVVE